MQLQVSALQNELMCGQMSLEAAATVPTKFNLSEFGISGMVREGRENDYSLIHACIIFLLCNDHHNHHCSGNQACIKARPLTRECSRVLHRRWRCLLKQQ
jgi:hypothetical protein